LFITVVPITKLFAWVGTLEEYGTLTQGGALVSLVPLVRESNPKLVFAAIFAQLFFHSTAWRKSCCIMTFVNIATAALLLEQILGGAGSFSEMHFVVVVFSAFVVFCNLCFYAWNVLF
jgi:hypothetical protein